MYDLILLGGGATALNFAIEFSATDSKKKILILEKRPNYINDRTWSFWLKDSSNFRHMDILKKSWKQWMFSEQNLKTLQKSTGFSYVTLSSQDFYKKALAIIHQDSRIDLELGCEVQQIKHSQQKGAKNSYQITSSKNIYRSKMVYDSRTPALEVIKNSCSYYQIFYGLEIEVNEDVFLSNTVSLMEDLSITKRGLEFLYILPFSQKRALIELTIFTENSMSPLDLEKDLKARIIKKVNNEHFSIIHSEGSILPMGRLKMDKAPDTDTYKSVGSRGGFLRESSGYSFHPIYEWSRHAAKALVDQEKLVSWHPHGYLQTLLDRHFIKTLKKFPDASTQIFMKMAQNLSGDEFASFMSGTASLSQISKMILAMPKIPFVRSLWK